MAQHAFRKIRYAVPKKGALKPKYVLYVFFEQVQQQRHNATSQTAALPSHKVQASKGSSEYIPLQDLFVGVGHERLELFLNIVDRLLLSHNQLFARRAPPKTDGKITQRVSSTKKEPSAQKPSFRWRQRGLLTSQHAVQETMPVMHANFANIRTQQITRRGTKTCQSVFIEAKESGENKSENVTDE